MKLDFKHSRSLKQIKQDIDEINDMMLLAKGFEEEYSDDPALSLSIRSLEYKQSLLFKELEVVNLKTMRESFDIRLDSSTIRKSMISLSFAGDILTSFQEVITSIVNKQMNGNASSQTRVSNKIKKESQLNILATGVGSFRIVVTPNITPISNEFNPPTITALEKFNHLLECGDDINKIIDIRAQLGLRVVDKYKDFINVLVQNKSNILFYDLLGKKRFQSINITKSLAENIYNTLNRVEEIPEKIESFTGKLRGIDIVTKNFRFEIDHEKYITGKYDTNIEDKVTKPDFGEEQFATFKHYVRFNKALEKESDDWLLIDINNIK